MAQGLAEQLLEVFEAYHPTVFYNVAGQPYLKLELVLDDEDAQRRLIEQMTRPDPTIDLERNPFDFVQEAKRKACNMQAYAEILLAAWMARWEVPPEDASLSVREDRIVPGAVRLEVSCKPGTGKLKPLPAAENDPPTD